MILGLPADFVVLILLPSIIMWVIVLISYTRGMKNNEEAE